MSSHSISRMSFGLFIAAVVLVVPLIVLVYLYLTELNREIKLLDRQVSSIRVMQQFVALQINLVDEYYGRFYPSRQALQQFAEPDNPIDANQSRAEPIALLNTQFKELERELNKNFKGDFRTWPVVKAQLIVFWEDENWPASFAKLLAVNTPGRDFVNDLFFASNLDLSTSDKVRAAAQLLFVDVGQLKASLFVFSEQLALLAFLPPTPTIEEDIRLLDSNLDKIYIEPLADRSVKYLGDNEFMSAAETAKYLVVDDLVEMSKRLLEKRRRLLFFGAIEGEIDDMGLAFEVETLRGLTWERFNSHNRIQIQLARLLEYELTLERKSVSSWRALVLLVVLSMIVFGILLGTYIISSIRAAQMHLGRQNISLEAIVKSRTEEIVSAKNEAEQLNKILGKQTHLSSELARKAEMANSAKSLFLAAMSHEIRTPLNAVLGGATILGKTDLNARQKGILSLITQSGKTLLDLINEILDFSKIEADQLHLEEIPFDLEVGLIDVVSMFSLKAKEKGIYLRLFVDSGVEGLWIGDPLRFKQIVINLLSNAIKFTHVGGISVRVALSDQGEVVVGIHDTGIGIQSDQLKNLFEAFVQSDSSTTRKYGGTGLGLSISKRLAILQNGDIAVESVLGRGSSFVLSLALQRTGEPVVVEALTGVDVCLLSATPELERQLRQWCARLQVFEDVNQLAFYLDNVNEQISDQGQHPIVIVAESAALIHHHDQWVQEITRRGIRQLAFPWVLLTSQDAIDCEDSQQITEELSALGANVQLPLFSSGSLIRQAIKRAYTEPKNAHEIWIDSDTVVEPKYYSGRVLLVEDVYFNQVIARELLESFGLVVESAENGVQAVDFMEQAYKFSSKDQMPIKLILMDLHMPEMNGLDATRRIRELEASMRLASTPIVAMTADVLVETREDIIRIGMNGYLSKPFEEADLHEILERYFDVLSTEERALSTVKLENINQDEKKLPNSEVDTESVTPAFMPVIAFDHQALSRRLRGRTDRMAELTESFLSGLPTAVDNIQTLVKDKKFKELSFAAHTLKGSAANLGAIQLQNASARIERFGKQLESEEEELDLMALQGVVDTLDSMVIALGAEVNAYLRSL